MRHGGESGESGQTLASAGVRQPACQINYSPPSPPLRKNKHTLPSSKDAGTGNAWLIKIILKKVRTLVAAKRDYCFGYDPTDGGTRSVATGEL